MAIMSLQMGVTSRAKNSKGGQFRNCKTASKSHYISRTGRYDCTPKPMPTGGKEDEPKAADQFKYNSRKEQFADRHADEIVFKGNGNMPKWAKTNPQEDEQHYWDACDKYERANGRLSRDFILALPRELTDEQRLELTECFCIEIARTKAFDRLPFSFAIHQDKDNHNPHAHIMISERINDGIPRNASTWFKRANTKNPEDGGALKTQELKTIKWLYETRRKWAEFCNILLEKKDWIDHRSFKKQGIERLPTVHVGKTKYMDEKRKALGLSTPLDRTKHNEQVREVNAMHQEFERMKQALEHSQSKGTSAAASGVHTAPAPASRPDLTTSIEPRQTQHAPTRLQQVTARVNTKPLNLENEESLRRFIERLIAEISDNQRKLWENDLTVLNTQSEYFKAETKRLRAQAEQLMREEIKHLQSDPVLNQRLLLADDKKRDLFFQQIEFRERHTASSPWEHEIKILQVFADAMASKSKQPRNQNAPRVTWNELTKKMELEAKLRITSFQPSEDIFVNNPSPSAPEPEAPKQVSAAELEAQEQARKDRLKKSPFYFDTSPQLKPKPW